MLSQLRFAVIITAILAISGPAMAQPMPPANAGVRIDKQIIDNGLSHSVKYIVTGGSPQLQALVHRVEWAENELSVIDQMQLLKLDTVVNERRLAAIRTTQLSNPYFPTGFSAPYFAAGYGADGASSLQRALGVQLAYEATPQAAMQMIGFLQQQQTLLDAELKALPPAEKKAAEGPVDALLPRLAALSGGDAPPPPAPPVAPLPPQVSSHAPAGVNAAIDVEWGASWYPAEVVRANGGLTLVHYTGWSSAFDEWVPASRMRPAATVAALPQIQPSMNPLALGQMVNQQFLLVQQQLMQPQ